MIIGKNELPELRATTDATIALRLGSYDLLHSGHQNGISFAADQADITVVGVMPDDYLRRRKGPGRPINSEQVRVAAIDKADSVDYTFIATDEVLGLAGIMRKLHPDVYVEGHEHGHQALKAGFLGMLGIRYLVDHQPYYISTTSMITQLGLSAAYEHASLSFAFEQGAA